MKPRESFESRHMDSLSAQITDHIQTGVLREL